MIEYRISDIKKLRAHLCQDFLKMIICSDWRDKLYNKAVDAVTNKRVYKGSYSPIYDKIREKGLDNISVDDLDVSVIYQMITFQVGTSKISDVTKDAFNRIKDDRNVEGHSSENEDEEELFLRALLEMSAFKAFITTADKNEPQIPDDERLAFIKKWHKKINDLKAVISDEYYKTIIIKRNAAYAIKRVQDSFKPESMYLMYQEYYSIQKFSLFDDRYEAYEFFKQASDAGIALSHYNAAFYSFQCGKYNEMFIRLKKVIKSEDEYSIIESVKTIINDYLKTDGCDINKVEEIFGLIRAKGYTIEETDNPLIKYTCRKTKG